MIWKVMAGISGAGLLSLLLLKEIPMNMEVNEKYGLHDNDADDRTKSNIVVVGDKV